LNFNFAHDSVRPQVVHESAAKILCRVRDLAPCAELSVYYAKTRLACTGETRPRRPLCYYWICVEKLEVLCLMSLTTIPICIQEDVGPSRRAPFQVCGLSSASREGITWLLYTSLHQHEWLCFQHSIGRIRGTPAYGSMSSDVCRWLRVINTQRWHRRLRGLAAGIRRTSSSSENKRVSNHMRLIQELRRTL
jgi:hypothetical protein